MLRLASAVPLALALAALPAAPPATPCPDIYPHEPAVLYEVSGSTIAGPSDLELLVYGDGWARVSSATAGTSGQCQQVFVGRPAARALLERLAAEQAFTLCDGDQPITDMPLATLTVMRPATDTRAHSMSWILADSSFRELEQELGRFLATWFPGF